MRADRIVVLSLLILIGAACAPAVQLSDEPRLAFHGQPDADTLAQWRDDGVDVVINLRPADEMAWDERSAVEGLGMQYHQVGIGRAGPGFDRAAIAKITALVDANPGRDIALHCSSGNRAAAWYAIYLVENGTPLPQALAQAQQAGMTRPALADRVNQYLQDSD
ncbi:MAG: hypothetical protein HKN49_09760 [Gammaproteobacteria bacterium]|nr:hypothetical protein [Gammaproteobacteria bacterium]